MSNNNEIMKDLEWFNDIYDDEIDRYNAIRNYCIEVNNEVNKSGSGYSMNNLAIMIDLVEYMNDYLIKKMGINFVQKAAAKIKNEKNNENLN